MVESVTLNYRWTKPEVTKSAATWGGYLNTDLDSIDALVFANQQGIVPVGGIQMFGGATAPANWLICDGRSLPTTGGTYDALFAVLQYAHGGSGANFNLPNLASRFPLGANPGNPVGQSAGSYSVPIAVGNLPPHNHPASQDAHNHGASQDPHNHGITTGNHSHGITTGNHSHAIPYDLINPTGTGLTSGGSSWQLAGGQRTDTAGNLGGFTDTAGSLGGGTDTRQPGVYTDSRQPNVYTGNTGSGTPLSVVPQYVALTFIIRFK